MISRHKDFTYYIQPICNPPCGIIKTDGAYVINNLLIKRPTDLMFFYEDGTCRIETKGLVREFIDSIFWIDPAASLKRYSIELNEVFSGYRSENWGHYLMNKDSIFMQVFTRYDVQNNVMRDVVECRGVIKNDSILVIFQEIYKPCGAKFMLPAKQKDCDNYGYDPSGSIYYNPPIEYNFYQTPFKPDSSYAWFKHKKWYKKDLHESRK